MWSIAFVVALLAPTGLAPPSSCLLPPVAAPVVDPFRAPPCEFCPGHRGLEYGAAPGAVVRAAAAGVVSFAGVVADTRYVVVDHAVGGLRATYGDLAASELAVGDVVTAGAVIGRVGDRGLYFGLRRGETYVDPAPLLGRLVERLRLVPTDGTPPRPAPRPRLRCAAAG